MHLLLASLAALFGSAAWSKSLAGRGNAFHYLQSDGQVYGFGLNAKGALGTGDVADSAFPVQMLGVLGATDIAGGLEHVCIVDQGDAARCVGGQLGQGSADSTALVQVQGLASGVAEIHAGDRHSCAVLASRGVRCWGNNAVGQLGDGTEAARYAPVAVLGFESGGAQQIALGGEHTCVLSTAGRVLCAGGNQYWAIGRSFPLHVTTMADVNLVPAAAFVACGTDNTCIVTAAGEVYCWGMSNRGQLGSGRPTSYVSAPTRPLGLESQAVFAVWMGGNMAYYGLDADGSAMALGANLKGQLGLGDTDDRLEASAKFAGGKQRVVEIRSGGNTACALFSDKSIQCVGDNEYGQLGRGVGVSSSLAVLSVEHPTPNPTTSEPTSKPTSKHTPKPTAQVAPEGSEGSGEEQSSATTVAVAVAVPLLAAALLLAGGLMLYRSKRRARKDAVVPKLQQDVVPVNHAASVVYPSNDAPQERV
ncbi:hypothetical protein BASA81_015859 [Batrachochytrium salamandrivorans]|nr:hypothetical protein BASA81_015859 [Batrachochytrium salamandrivorans]